APHRVLQCLALGRVRGRHVRGLGQLVAGELVDLALAPLRGAGVHERTAHIAVEGTVVLDAVPGDVRLGERGLQEVFRVAGVRGQRTGGAQQYRTAVADVGGEGRVGVTSGVRPAYGSRLARCTRPVGRGGAAAGSGDPYRACPAYRGRRG